MKSDNADQLAQLERLAKLHADGSLSTEEFEQLKSKLLSAGADTDFVPLSGQVPSPAEAPQAQPLRTEPEPVTLAVVIGWAWTAFFVILGFALLFQHHIAAGSVALLSALIAFPPLNSFVLAAAGLHAQIIRAVPLVLSAGLVLLGASWLGLMHPVPVLAATDSGSSAPEAPQPSIAPDTATPSIASTPDATTPPASTEVPSPSPAQSEPETPDAVALTAMQSRFGNTVITQSAAAEWHLHFNADGTVTGSELKSGYAVSGAWKITDGEVCVTFDPAIPGTDNPECKPISQHQIGDRWLSNGTLTILAQGIQ